MMSRPSKSLKQHWYERLKEEGFDDIEDQNQEYLIKWHGPYFQCRYSPAEYFENQRYFQIAREFLLTHKFKNRREKQIWFMYSEGMTVREIAPKFDLSKSRIAQIISRLVLIMRGL